MKSFVTHTTGGDKYVTTHYELTNHLGNVMAVISDAPGDGAQPTVESLTDYYPFGMAMPGRKYERKSGEDYRYGFQGQDKEKELWGGESSFFKYRISDNRLGRFFSVDPLSSKFPWNSSYAFSENRVIDGVEMEGLEYINANNEHISCLRNNDDGSYEAWDKRGDLSDTKSAIKESDFGTEIRGGNLKE